MPEAPPATELAAAEPAPVAAQIAAAVAAAKPPAAVEPAAAAAAAEPVAAAGTEPAAAAADSRKRGVIVPSDLGDDGAKRARTAEELQLSDSSLMCVAVNDEDTSSGLQHLGSVRIWIMETHPRHCKQSPQSFCYARCAPIKALLSKGASIHAVRAPDDECGIAIHINGERAAAFDREQETAFLAAMDAGQIRFDRGVAASWAEIDFDVLAGPANLAATVPPEVQACDGFERGVLARNRMCDGNDCPCC